MGQQKEQPLPQNTNAALQEVMKAVRGLQAIYEKENAALLEANTNAFMDLQEDKIKAAMLYQSYMGQMLSRKKDLEKADPVTKQKLKEAYAEFTEVSDKNLVAIERMQRCTEMVGDTIRNAAIRAVKSQRGTNYGQNGSFQNSKNKGLSSGVSETA